MAIDGGKKHNWKKAQQERRKTERRRGFAAKGTIPRPALSPWEQEQKQNRRWLDAQMQRPDNDINKHQRTELHRWFSFPSLAAQRAPPSMKEGLRLSDASRGHVDRLTAERDAAKIRRGDVKADGESVMVKDWWVSEAEKRKRARRADELLHSGEMNTRRQKDYERTKAYLARKAEAIEEAGGTWVAKIAMIGGKGKGTEAEMEDEEIGEEEENGESGEESEGED